MKVGHLKSKSISVRGSRQKAEKKDSIWNRDISLKKRFSNRERANFYEQMFVLLEAGLDVNTALGHVIDRSKSQFLKDIFINIQKKLQVGHAIYECLENAGQFSNYETYSIKIGEESGRLLEVLENLTQYFNEKVEQRRDIISAVSYPLLIINAAIGAVAFMIFFIIPVFEDVFSRFGGELPWLTQRVLDLSVFFRQYFWVILGILVVFVLVFIRGLKYDIFYQVMERIVFRLPYVGQFVYQSMMTKFTNSMGLLLGAKVPLVNALEMNKGMFRSIALKNTIDKSISDLISGLSYSESVNRLDLYDDNFKVFLKIGEESNQMEKFFVKLSKDYRSAMKHQTSVLNTVLEPLLIISLGAIVGIILISMYLPMFEISTQMSFPE